MALACASLLSFLLGAVPGGMVLVYLTLGGGFLWFAAFDLAFAVALSLLYLNLLKAELMSRP